MVADLAVEVKSLGLSSELDDAVNKVALAEFLVSSLGGLGVSPSAISSVLVRASCAMMHLHMHKVWGDMPWVQLYTPQHQ